MVDRPADGRGNVSAGASASVALAAGAQRRAMVFVYAVLMGISGGIVTVAFFTCWGKVFGRAHLGAIQGVAHRA